ncbi:hypothetical protein NQ318_015998 [Aromia moschata]|uniref:Transposase n=1 Tax=Aromia moschata TaxID=1265417 RepID=A0AAV8Y3C4_9CUCU|nr:hypothetical protein NQ318_015998 [Aromia moschata]
MHVDHSELTRAGIYNELCGLTKGNISVYPEKLRAQFLVACRWRCCELWAGQLTLSETNMPWERKKVRAAKLEKGGPSKNYIANNTITYLFHLQQSPLQRVNYRYGLKNIGRRVRQKGPHGLDALERSGGLMPPPPRRVSYTCRAERNYCRIASIPASRNRDGISIDTLPMSVSVAPALPPHVTQRPVMEGDTFLTRIVTCDETWIHHYRKEEAASVKAKTRLSAGKCELLNKVRAAYRRKRRDQPIRKAVLLDKARPHAEALTSSKLEEMHWTQLDHLAYSPNLAPCGFRLFGPKRSSRIATI